MGRRQDVKSKREEVRALKAHARIKPMNLSKTLFELVEYITQREGKDPLLYPPKDNPFREKKIACAVL
ncbi:unnamed protein product [Rodentolepis nana]|uniref:G protein gamma domain-containing protein n=1 Tax=Rodentolepis nana TaxID=102285 RepID=A0A0R3TD05_RODNA|nr:unnamed protein product [Rodentolepis nana]